MQIPRLSHENESFEEYINRFPRELAHVPEDLVKSWFWYHNDQAVECSTIYDFKKWKFRSEKFSNEEIMKIRHYDYYLSKLDEKGEVFLRGRMEGYDTADFMLDNGTFPCAILITEDCGKHKHHQSVGDETMLEPYQIIEGNRRLGFLRALINTDHPNLRAWHSVWVATIAD